MPEPVVERWKRSRDAGFDPAVTVQAVGRLHTPDGETFDVDGGGTLHLVGTGR